MIYLLYILIFIIVQVLVLNHLHLFGVATPLLYVYLVVLYHRNMGHMQRLFLAFFTGLSIDMFSNTPGLSSASLTLAAFIQPVILEIFLKKEDAPDFRPSVANMGFVKYFTYVLFIALVFCLSFFALEFFSFNYWHECIISCFSSLALTMTFILVIDSVRK